MQTHTHTNTHTNDFTSVLCQLDLRRKVLQCVGLPVCDTLFLLWMISSSAPDSLYAITTSGFRGSRQCLLFMMTLTLHTYQLKYLGHLIVYVLFLGSVMKYAFPGTKTPKEFKTIMHMGYRSSVASRNST